MRKFGLIGYPLSHSFSKKYFTEKFHRENIRDCEYDNFEIKKIEDLPVLILTYPNLNGFNVTIPYKESIIPYLDELDQVAKKVGAVNVVKISGDGKKTGYNSDYYGFRYTLERWLGTDLKRMKALVLGTGGAAKAVKCVLEDCNIKYRTVSRQEGKGDYIYFDFTDDPDLILEYRLIINTTPLGMFPDLNEAPNLPYETMDGSFYLYDLIYNPEKTLFLKKGESSGTRILNGLDMLVLQAEKSWDIWNE
ncbi:MAG: shikimate dehydrogenase [Cyclobacteriaceae bacterium]|nr:shikimate dehydrogenase [Cyclobacteriaceae bacterium]